MKLPEKIKIGGINYLVEWSNGRLISDDNRRLYGEIDFEANKITVSSMDCKNDIHLFETLLHESLHGLSLQYNLDLSESQITRLSYGLLQVFADNPCLAQYFKKEVTK